LITCLVSEKFTTGDYVALFPSYGVFFEELIYCNPEVLVKHSDELKSLCVKMVNMRIDQSFFLIVGAVFEKLNLEDLKRSGWLNFAAQSALSVASQAPADNTQQISYRSLYFKEFLLHFIKFGVKFGFSGTPL